MSAVRSSSVDVTTSSSFSSSPARSCRGRSSLPVLICRLEKTAAKAKPEELKFLEGIQVEELTLPTQKTVVKACIDRIVLHPKNLFIFYRFPIDEKGKTKERLVRVR